MSDPYIDPESGILRNKLHISDENQLEQAIGSYASTAQVLISMDPPEPTGDSQMLKTIHQRLFGPVFTWAGKFRTVQLSKGIPADDYENYFFDARFLDNAMFNLHSSLAELNYLQSMNRHEFIVSLAQLYADLNYIHPFREGNGRTQRVFWTIMAFNAGWTIDWVRVPKQENDKASRESYIQNDLHGLEIMFAKHVYPAEETLQIWAGHLPDEKTIKRRRNHGLNR